MFLFHFLIPTCCPACPSPPPPRAWARSLPPPPQCQREAGCVLGAEGEFCLLDSLEQRVWGPAPGDIGRVPWPSLRVRGSLSARKRVPRCYLGFLLGDTCHCPLSTLKTACSLLFHTSCFFPRTVPFEGNTCFGGAVHRAVVCQAVTGPSCWRLSCIGVAHCQLPSRF